MSSTPFWKKIHQTIVSGYSKTITEDIVAEILKLSQDELLAGLLAYKPFAKQAYDEWSAKADVNVGMKEFVLDLSQDLNLDATVTYPLTCNYLMFEYCGKIKEFWQVTRIGTAVNLKEHLRNFYTSERMFLLKTWRYILEHVQKDDYEFAGAYRQFLGYINKEELIHNLIEQFEVVTHEMLSKKFNETDSYVDAFLCRNLREQTEILSILTLAIQHHPLTIKQVSKVIMMFIQNSFSTIPPLYELRTHMDSKDLEELMYTEIGCYFVILQNYWDQPNPDLWTSPIAKDLDECLQGQHLNKGITLIVVAWLILKFKTASGDRRSAEKATELLERQPFTVLNSLVSCEIFKNCLFGEVVVKACHKLMDEVSLLYHHRKRLYEQQGVIGAIAEFLTRPNLVETCLEKRNGIDTLMEIAMNAFPYDFFSFTSFARSLLGHKQQYKQIVILLHNIPVFLSDLTWSIPRERASVLTRDQSPLPDSDLIIFPKNTTVHSYRIFEKNLMQYRAEYSYFIYLEYLLNLMITGAMSQRKLDEDIVQKVIAGFGVVVEAIKNCKDLDFKLIGVDRIVKRFDKVLTHLEGPVLSVGLVKTFFDIQNAFILYRDGNFFDSCPDMLWKAFFPQLNKESVANANQNVNQLLYNVHLFEETDFMRFFKAEEDSEDHSLVLKFVNILHNIMKAVFQFKNFQLSGVTFLLNYVFVQHQSWFYKNENQKTEITLACLKIIHIILQKDVTDLNPEEEKMFSLCQNAFLNNAYIIESFLKLFVKEKHYLLYTMERESNWIAGPKLQRMTCIRMQMALLLLLMNQRKTFGSCVLDQRLQYVVKPVASYFTNSYSPVVAELACRFLEKLAYDQYTPLLALLELDHYQVQALFLERLRDPLEEETVKIAIIDLINTCVSKQNGMTAAFFNLKCFKYWDGTEKEDQEQYVGDSVSDYIIDYLQNIKKSHDYLKNQLQLGILRLLHNLWVNHRESLIDSVANLKEFWPVMTDPFFSDYVQDVEVYTVILKIMIQELNSNVEEIDPKLINTMEKFYTERETLQDWLDFMLERSAVNSPDNLELLNAWMEFVVVTKRSMMSKITPDIRFCLIDACLDGMNVEGGGFNNAETIYIWSQQYLVLTQSWAVADDEDQTRILSKLSTFVYTLHSYYRHLQPKMKEIILSVINCTIVGSKEYFKSNMDALLLFLYHVGNIVDTEYTFLQSDVQGRTDEQEKSDYLKPWLVIIFIGNSILNLNIATREIALWFFYRKFLKKVINSISHMMAQRSTLPFAKLAIDFLITYAETPSLVKDLLPEKSELSSFYDMFMSTYKARAPRLTIGVGTAVLCGLPTDLREWWILLITVIKLNRILITTLGDEIPDSFYFSLIIEHDQLISQAVSLTKYTLDMTALTLVCECLMLIYRVLRLKPDWILIHQPSYLSIMEGTKITLNACVLSITRYKKINFYRMIDGKLLVEDQAPTEALVTVLNKLSEIVLWACLCLSATKPDIHTLIHSSYEKTSAVWIENDFSVPRFEMPITSTLTYGTLLCLADYLCRTVNQLSPGAPSFTPTFSSVSLRNLSKEMKSKSMDEILEHCIAIGDQYIGFVVYARSEELKNEKLKTFLQYEMSEFSWSISSSVIPHLHYETVNACLASLMTFLAGEIFCTIRYLPGEMLFTFKREISSEIQFFYEFVRRKTNEQFNNIVTTPKSSSSSASTTPRSLMSITPRSSTSNILSQVDTDITKRFVYAKFCAGEIEDVADNNYLLLISNFLITFCDLSN